MSRYEQQHPSFSDIRRPERRSPVSAWPEEELGTLEEWHIPDPPEFLKSGQSVQLSFATEKDEKREALLRWIRHPVVVLTVALCLFGIGTLVFGKASSMKGDVVRDGEAGYRHLMAAAEALESERFDEALGSFAEAERFFSRGERQLSFWGGPVFDFLRFIPGLSKPASGRYALEAGKHFAAAGVPLAEMIKELSSSKALYAQGGQISFLEFLTRIKGPLREAAEELEQGNGALTKVNIGDIPEEKRAAFVAVREHLPVLIGLIGKFEKNEALFEELLGGNGPRKYLFLLQNNHELRATGGFVGSYGLLEVNGGAVRRFFVDGIFNPDGQLKENIVPPQPIQKISAAWSLHDSNWFPDFPVSAEKAIFFYEKTGGPTVDGVVTLTPTVMQKLLAVTGPITLPQYGLTVDAENFIPVIQEQVEVKYDKEENKPKKVLADLSVLLLEKVFASQDRTTLYRIAQALVEGLGEKQMLLYMRHPETEALIDAAGWSGRVLDTPRDYLSVVHTNINGYKTDGVIDETIRHTADIQSDGSIVDTVSITRTHRGGHTPYDWWNRVNADYLRVYVPEGATLLSAKGTTWEFPEAPLEYDRLGFRRDADVEREERSIVVDEKSGTRIYRDAGKTVFGAWVYVSPQESVTVEYRYRLPFSIDTAGIRLGTTDTYSVLHQKQSGSTGSKLSFLVSFPEHIRPIWQTGGNLIPYAREWKLETELVTDAFAGMVFGAVE